jgi:hypothetical protein
MTLDQITAAIDALYMRHVDPAVPIATIRQELRTIVEHTARLLEALPNEEDRNT